MSFRSASVAALVATLLVFPACASTAERGLSLTLVAGKGTFKTGQPISLELKVHYVGKEPLTLSFSTSQRYDFQIEKEGGEILWRWSDGRMFAQVLGQFTLSPELPHVRYRAVFEGHLPPGRYKVRGILTTSPRPLSAATPIKIR